VHRGQEWPAPDDAGLHRNAASLAVLYRGDGNEAELRQAPASETRPITVHPDGRVTVRVDLPPGGMILA